IHDLSALVTIANQKSIKLRIVVINNNGGQIFRMLPVFASNEYFADYFETPQHINVAEVSRAIGIKSICVEHTDDFKTALSIEDQIVLIECKTDPSGSMKLRSELWG